VLDALFLRSRASPVAWTMDILYEGLGKTNCKSEKKKKNNFFSDEFVSIFGHQR
jgi:hypothetical protein